jgi:hypothetical protein
MTEPHTTEAHFVIACLEKCRNIPVASEKETRMPLLLSALIGYAVSVSHGTLRFPLRVTQNPAAFDGIFMVPYTMNQRHVE